MTASKLEQYTALMDEIADLERRTARIARKKGGIVSDTVRGSSMQFPYSMRTVKITGEAVKAVRTVQRIERLRRKRQQKARALLAEIEEWMTTVEDARIRRMIEMHYIQRLTWRQVAKRVYGSVLHEDAVRKSVRRYFE